MFVLHFELGVGLDFLLEEKALKLGFLKLGLKLRLPLEDGTEFDVSLELLFCELKNLSLVGLTLFSERCYLLLLFEDVSLDLLFLIGLGLKHLESLFETALFL